MCLHCLSGNGLNLTLECLKLLMRRRDDDRIARRKPRFNLVMLDCCRTFKYEDEDIGRGAEELNYGFSNAHGTCIVYACAPNDKTSDGKSGDNNSMTPITYIIE